jgi:ribosomal protein S27AE
VAIENTQRSYRAPCPGCGAPVDFLSAQSTHAICGYCRSMVVREGDVLKRIGKMAELFDDHSPLQLQTSGVWNGKPFTLIGRLQYRYGEGTWTEWHALLQDGSSAYLGEDNGAYVFSTPLPQQEVAPAEVFRIGASTAINGQPFSVASNQPVALMSAQGELPHLPELGHSFAMVELRSQSADAGAAAEVLSIDYSHTPPEVSKGRAVLLDNLKLSGLRDAASKEEKGRSFNCPNCGATLSPLLATTQSMTCGTCHSIIDLSQGIAGELRHAAQDEPVQPLIALGSSGSLQGAEWQVVGYQHRMGSEPGDADEHFGWDEYLLFNRKRGFIFLVDSTEGWSVVQPATGAPVVSSNGQSATYLGTRYQLKESYNAETNYVLGEFYWQVERGQRTSNRDYASGQSLLSMEQSAQELTWSVGGQIASDTVAQAFKLQDKKELLQRSDVKPFAAGGAIWMRPDFWVFIVIVLIILSMSTCSSNCDPAVQDCSIFSGARTSGGSFGGFSTGGGHK